MCTCVFCVVRKVVLQINIIKDRKKNGKKKRENSNEYCVLETPNINHVIHIKKRREGGKIYHIRNEIKEESCVMKNQPKRE